MKAKTKTILFMVLIFIAGIALGGFIVIKYLNKHVPPKHVAIQKLIHERLNLDAEQKAKIDSILESRKNKLDALRKQAFFMRDTINSEILSFLRADQVAEYEKLIKELRFKGPKQPEPDSLKR